MVREENPSPLDGCLMSYVPKYLKIVMTLPTPPKTFAGFGRRFVADTKAIGRLDETDRIVFLKIVRSWTLMHAEAVDRVKFRQLCRELSIRSPTLSWHRLVAENAGKLLSILESLPNDDGALALLAKVDADQLHRLDRSRQLNQSLAASRLRRLVTMKCSDA
jgi:hypothetical protein